MKKKEALKNKEIPFKRFNTLLKKTESGDFKALASVITFLEENEFLAFKSEKLLNSPSLAFRIGLTGPIGVGKSTLTGNLISELRKFDLKVGVLTIDPSSPIEKQGSLLGDRIRYNQFVTDPKVFIRSMSSRGALGGMNAPCASILRAYDVAGFDVVLIETTGVGQTESDIFHVADEVSLLLSPESGDAIQFMKAGVLEIADQFIINKSDFKGADFIEQELKYFLSFSPKGKDHQKQKKTIFKTVAKTGEGVDSLAQFYVKKLKKLNQNQKTLTEWKKKRNAISNLRKEAYFMMKKKFDHKILKTLESMKSKKDLKYFFNSFENWPIEMS